MEVWIMELSPDVERRLRKVFKLFNKFMLTLWRLGLARYGNPSRFGGAIMVIKHTGRKSGLTRFAPVNYHETEQAVYCTAGFGAQTDWYQNILENPDVELWLPDSRWEGIAEDISHSQDRVDLLRQVLIASGFAGPLFGVNPRQMADKDFEKLLEHYRLIRIRKSAPATGPGGPGDLAWVWPLATFTLLLVLINRRRNSS
jgi:deazaflavin-dependent oxidoreductase (nitroreductase family)